MINFAFGEIMTFGAYAAFVLTQSLHWPFYAAVSAAIVLTVLLGIGIERVAYRPLVKGGDRHLPLISSIGVSIALLNVYEAIFGSRTLYLKNQELHPSLLFATIAVELLSLALVLRFTSIGDQVAGLASNRELAQLVGVNPSLNYTVVFALASALAVPAAVFEMCDKGISPTMGFNLGLLAFSAALLANMRSLTWTVVASFALGIAVEAAQYSHIGNERLVWVAFVIAAVVVAAGRRMIQRHLRISRGEDLGA
jgi:branched-chain amino acid transport system permease protein